MKRYLKPLVVAASLIAALFLTISRHGANVNLSTHRSSNADPARVKQKYDLMALKVFNVALVRIKDNYVKPKLIKPKLMLIAALDGVEKTVAEVLVEQDRDKKKLKVKVDSYEKEFDITGVDSPWALSSRIKYILRFIQAHLLKSTKIQDVEYAAINGMLSTLDPHSILLKPETYNEMKLSTRGEFGGLGIVISMVKGVLTVMNPMKNTPADTAGIKACDQILKIGEESTVNMTLTQAVNRLRGSRNSKIEITLMRQGWTRPVKKVLTRAIIRVPAVKSRMLGKKIGYIKLSSFQGNSLSDIRKSLAKLKAKQMKGLILDLRGNPGGLLDQAVKISDLFIDSGTLVTTVAFAGKRREEKRAKAEGTEGRYPIVVLVNSGSASASEIVAGALKNLDRAVIIGKRTFGKGTVQVLYDNDDGSALKLTIAEYLTPGDKSIQATGIIPDVLTAPVFVLKDFIHLRKTDLSRREKDLAKHLTHIQVGHSQKPSKTLQYLAEDPNKNIKPKPELKNLCLFNERVCKPPKEDRFVEDFQIRVARDLLAQTRYWRRSQILSHATNFFTRHEAAEEKRIIAALKKHNVDWSITQPTEGRPSIKVSVTTEPRRGKALACEKMKLKVTVKNTGTAPTSRLKAISKSSNNLFNGFEFIFGKVEPGATRTWVVPIKIRDAPTRVDDVTFKFEEAHGNAPPPYTFPISIAGKQRPVFAYGYQMIDDLQGNLDGQIQRGERVRLFVKVRNTGKGTSYRTITTLKNLSGVGIFIRKGRFVLGPLKPGETRTTSFTLDVQKSYAMPKFKVELMVYDDALREMVTNKLEFGIVDSKPGPRAAGGNVRISSTRGNFRAWPAAAAPKIGQAPRGAAFKVLGRTSGWYRVEVDKNRPAFVSAKEITPGGHASYRKFRPQWQVTPPKLSLKVPTNITDSKTIQITGSAIDQEQVKDMFIFVRNPDAKISSRKIYYRSNSSSSSPRRLDFSALVPLWKGANYVTIFVRENADVQASESIVIYRKKGVALAGSKGPGSKKPTRRSK